MNFQEMFDEGNERPLYELCLKYYDYLNEYTKLRQEAPPKEMAQKLELHIDEYSELLIFLSDGGFDSLVQAGIARDISNGATFIDDQLTNIDGT